MNLALLLCILSRSSPKLSRQRSPRQQITGASCITLEALILNLPHSLMCFAKPRLYMIVHPKTRVAYHHGKRQLLQVESVWGVYISFTRFSCWYLDCRLTQSVQIKFVVGSKQESFPVPGDLLRHRSESFQKLFDIDEPLSFPHIEPSTFDDFYRWSLREDPCIWEDIQQNRLEK